MPRQCITAKHYPKFWKCSNYQKHTYRTKFFKRNFSVAIAVSMDDGFIDYLLQLCIFQVAANHHFEHLEQLTVWDVTVFVHVVDFKSDWKQGWNIKVSISSAYSSCSPYQICHKKRFTGSGDTLKITDAQLTNWHYLEASFVSTHRSAQVLHLMMRALKK